MSGLAIIVAAYTFGVAGFMMRHWWLLLFPLALWAVLVISELRARRSRRAQDINQDYEVPQWSGRAAPTEATSTDRADHELVGASAGR